MKLIHLLFCGTAFWSLASNAAPPQDFSAWTIKYPCDKYCRAEGFVEGSTEIYAIRHGSEICGFGEQVQGARPFKTPSIVFVGKLIDQVFIIQYQDSFLESNDQLGVAGIKITPESFIWHGVYDSSHGYFYLRDGETLNRLSKPKLEKVKEVEDMCGPYPWNPKKIFDTQFNL